MSVLTIILLRCSWKFNLVSRCIPRCIFYIPRTIKNFLEFKWQIWECFFVRNFVIHRTEEERIGTCTLLSVTSIRPQTSKNKIIFENSFPAKFLLCQHKFFVQKWPQLLKLVSEYKASPTMDISQGFYSLYNVQFFSPCNTIRMNDWSNSCVHDFKILLSLF